MSGHRCDATTPRGLMPPTHKHGKRISTSLLGKEHYRQGHQTSGYRPNATPCPSSLRDQGLQQLIITLVARLRIDRQLGTPRGRTHSEPPPSGNSRLCRAVECPMNSTSLAGRLILVCEDEPLIAIGIANAFKTAGPE